MPRFHAKPVIMLAGVLAGVVLSGALYHWVDPLPPRRFAMAAGAPGSVYDNVARQYAAILVRDGVTLEIRNTAGAMEGHQLLRDPAADVQAALTTFDSQPGDAELHHSLGGVFDAVIFIFCRSSDPVTQFAQLRGKRLAVGRPGTALRALVTQVLVHSGALDPATVLVDLDHAEATEALIAGQVDVAIFPSQLDGSLLQRALAAPGLTLMDVGQAEAIAKTVPGLKHVVFWQGLGSLSRNVPASDVHLIASRNRLLVRQDLHPALQYLLLKAMQEVHGGEGPFQRLGEFPAPQSHDLPLSPTAQAFYRAGSTFWPRYMAFWVSSLLDRLTFFVIPVLAMLVPLVGLAPQLWRWAHVRRIQRLHAALSRLQRELDAPRAEPPSRPATEKAPDVRLEALQAEVRALRVSRAFEGDLQLLRLHLRMVQEQESRSCVPPRASSPVRG